jgi:hypothetical protein
MAAALVIAIGVPAAIADAIGRGALRGRRLIYLALGGAVALIALIAIGLAAPQRFVSPDDLHLVETLFTGSPDWGFPALGTANVTLAMRNEPLLAGVLAVLGLATLLGPRWTQQIAPLPPAIRAVAWGAVALGLVLAFPWLAVDDPQGLGFRLRVIAFVPLALCAATIAGVVPVPSRDLVLAGVAAIVIAIAPRDTFEEGEIVTHPALVTSAMALDGHIPDGDIAIVPERHIAFMVAWYAHARVAIRPGDTDPAHRWRVLPLHFIGDGSPLDHALIDARKEPGLVPPLGVHPSHANGLVLVAESTWEWLLARLPADARRWFAAWHTI